MTTYWHLVFFSLLFLLVAAGPAAADAPVAGFSGTPRTGTAPLDITFTDSSTNTPTGWAWFFGDENYTAPWTEVNASAGWSARVAHSTVAMPDGGIVLMGGLDNGGFTNDTWRSTDTGATWTQVNESSGWSERYGHTSVAMPDASIVLMGGHAIDGLKNDVWRSADNGTTWTQVNASAGWSARETHSSVVMPDGSIVLMGGWSAGLKNDTWRSMDNGTTWTRQTASAGWSARQYQSSVVTPDGSIVLMGGFDNGGIKNDTWRSTDNGATWTQVNASAGWSARYSTSSVTMPDGSIVLMAGETGVTTPNDVWRSTDKGFTWAQVNESSGWSERYGHTSVAMPDGSIVLMGGDGEGKKNDTWRFQPTGSSEQDPLHTYTTPGTYQVALQAYNTVGYNSTRKAGYITVIAPPVADFIGSPTTGTDPLTVQFNDTSTGLGLTLWNWSFGDTTWFNTSASTLRNASHSYANAGIYTVALTVSNASGSDTKTNVGYILVNPPAPVADFTGIPTTGTAPLSVQFNDTSTGFGLTLWNWSFGDTTWFNTSASPLRNASHSYANAGIYTVALTVSNASGSDTRTNVGYIIVNLPPAPVALFSGTPTTGAAPLTVSFTDSSTGSPTGWVWFFGDENFTAPWTRVNASSGWTGRYGHSTVAMPDGSIVLTGGYPFTDDVWRSTDDGVTWTQVNASPGWSERFAHSSVAMPDGSIVLMGGDAIDGLKNDTWRSTDDGVTWTQVNASPGWSERFAHSSVAMPDGSIVLMGGFESGNNQLNDTWRSTDDGVTWTRVNASAGWSAREGHSSVAMPDGSIVLMGGDAIDGLKNDTWRSTDDGVTWTQVNASAGWPVRYYHSTVAMPDGSIVLMGGRDTGGDRNDVWRSTDNGITWAQVNESAGWPARSGHSSVAMPDSSIVLTGGYSSGYVNDTWRFMPAGSSGENPSHIYTAPGIYQVALQVYHAFGYNSTRKTGYINATALMANFTATPRSGTAPLTVIFTDSSTGSPTTWNWTFGDDSLENVTARNPVHSYAVAGNYTVSLNATNAAGSNIFTRTNYVTVFALPTVIAVSPASGPTDGGTRVTVTGTGFAGVTAVRFGSTAGTGLTVNSSTRITITSPAHAAGIVNVTVTTPGGTSALVAGDKFTYFTPPAVTALSPAGGPTAGGTRVTVTGTGFTGTTAVRFGSTAGTGLTVNSSTRITVRSPAHAAGPVNVMVTTPGGTSAVVAGDRFTYVAKPTVTSITPKSGPLAGNTVVTITGTGFTGATAVKFGTTKNTTPLTVLSATRITVRSPAHAAGVTDVTVTSPGGTSAVAAGDKFTYAIRPAVTSITPRSGPLAGNTIVTITGTGFTGATAVRFGTTKNSTFLTVVSATKITVRSPAHAAGVTDVTVTTPGGTSATSTADRFTYVAAPTVTALSPATGPRTGGTRVTVTGTGFTGATAVKFGTAVGASLTVNSSTRITVTSPAHAAGTVDVRVTTPGGTSTVGVADRYTYT